MCEAVLLVPLTLQDSSASLIAKLSKHLKKFCVTFILSIQISGQSLQTSKLASALFLKSTENSCSTVPERLLRALPLRDQEMT